MEKDLLSGRFEDEPLELLVKRRNFSPRPRAAKRSNERAQLNEKKRRMQKKFCLLANFVLLPSRFGCAGRDLSRRRSSLGQQFWPAKQSGRGQTFDLSSTWLSSQSSRFHLITTYTYTSGRAWARATAKLCRAIRPNSRSKRRKRPGGAS